MRDFGNKDTLFADLAAHPDGDAERALLFGDQAEGFDLICVLAGLCGVVEKRAGRNGCPAECQCSADRDAGVLGAGAGDGLNLSGDIQACLSGEAFRGQLAVKRALIARTLGPPLGGRGRIAHGNRGFPGPECCAGLADGGSDAVMQAREMGQGGVRVVELAQGNPSRKPFHIGEILALGQTVPRRERIGALIAFAVERLADEQRALICPFLRFAKAVLAGHFKHHVFRARAQAALFAPDHASIG